MAKLRRKKLRNPERIAFIVSLVEHALLATVVVLTMRAAVVPIQKRIEVDLMSMPANLSSGVDLPSAASAPQPPADKNIKPGNSKAKAEGVPQLSGSSLAPSEIGVNVESSILNTLDVIGTGVAKDLKITGGKVSGFTFSGTGMATGKPDNIFVQLTVKSGMKDSMQFAEKDIEKIIDNIIWKLTGYFRYLHLDKKQFKSFKGVPEVINYTEKDFSSPGGKPVAGHSRSKYTITKTLTINDLGKLKMEEIYEIIDRAKQFGATVIADPPAALPSEVFSATSAGQGMSKTQQTKGVSKVKVLDESTADKSEFINWHFNEDTLKKLIEQARGEAYKEAKEKVAAVKKLIKFKDSDMDVDYTENTSSTQTDEGEVTIRVDVTAVLKKTAQPAADPTAAKPKGK